VTYPRQFDGTSQIGRFASSRAWARVKPRSLKSDASNFASALRWLYSANIARNIVKADALDRSGAAENVDVVHVSVVILRSFTKFDLIRGFDHFS